MDTAAHATPSSELRERVHRLQERLTISGASAVITQTSSLFYFTGSNASGWLVVPPAGEPQLHVRRAVERTERETCWPVTRTLSSSAIAKAALAAADGGPVGLELDVTPAAEYLKIVNAVGRANFVDDIGHDVRTVRAVKSEWELSWIRQAARQVRLAMDEVAGQVEPGWREIDVFHNAEQILRREGHQGPMRMRRYNGEMYFGQVAAGANAALPAALDAPLGGAGLYPSVGKGASTRRLEAGDLLVLDLMGACNGYLSDCTRVVAVGGLGAVPPDLLEAQAWCTSVLEDVSSCARSGVTPQSLYEHALSAARDAGHAHRFMGVAPDQARFVGHGIGLEVDEYPFLAPGYDEPLVAGMVFALEPKLVYPGRAAVGIEDAFIVTEDGVEVLEAVPRDVLVGGR